jgi:general secretion pathway protein D
MTKRQPFGFVFGPAIAFGISVWGQTTPGTADAADISTRPQVVLRENGEAAPPIELVPEKGNRTFHLRTDEASLIHQVLHAYGIQAAIDGSVKSRAVPFDAADVDFNEAAKLVTLATGTFLQPLDALHVIALSDTPDNRSRYERQVTETVYFPGLASSELNDVANMARGIVGAGHSVVSTTQDTLTVRAPEAQLKALNQVCMEMVAGRSQLLLDVRMYEIDKTRATNVGMVLPGSTTVFNVPSEVNSILANHANLVNQILASDPALAGNYAAILAALIASGGLTGTVFNSPFAVFGGGLTETGVDLTGVNLNMLLNSSDSRSLDEFQVHVLDQEEATIRSGERYPIMASSYTSLAAGSSKTSSSSTIPQIQYEDLGLTLKVKPHVEGEKDISLNLEMKLDSLAGSTINNVPVLNNRQYSGMVSLHFGDSALIVSDMSLEDSLEMTGVPGFNDIPGFRDGTNRQRTSDTMELAILVTPHLVRLAHQKSAGPMLFLPQH